MYRKSRKVYQEAYSATGDYYVGINAATLAFLTGERDKAQELADGSPSGTNPGRRFSSSAATARGPKRSASALSARLKRNCNLVQSTAASRPRCSTTLNTARSRARREHSPTTPWNYSRPNHRPPRWKRSNATRTTSGSTRKKSRGWKRTTAALSASAWDSYSRSRNGSERSYSSGKPSVADAVRRASRPEGAMQVSPGQSEAAQPPSAALGKRPPPSVALKGRNKCATLAPQTR